MSNLDFVVRDGERKAFADPDDLSAYIRFRRSEERLESNLRKSRTDFATALFRIRSCAGCKYPVSRATLIRRIFFCGSLYEFCGRCQTISAFNLQGQLKITARATPVSLTE